MYISIYIIFLSIALYLFVKIKINEFFIIFYIINFVCYIENTTKNNIRM